MRTEAFIESIELYEQFPETVTDIQFHVSFCMRLTKSEIEELQNYFVSKNKVDIEISEITMVENCTCCGERIFGGLHECHISTADIEYHGDNVQEYERN